MYAKTTYVRLTAPWMPDLAPVARPECPWPAMELSHFIGRQATRSFFWR